MTDCCSVTTKNRPRPAKQCVRAWGFTRSYPDIDGGAENVARGNITTRDAEGNITRPGQFAEGLALFPATRCLRTYQKTLLVFLVVKRANQRAKKPKNSKNARRIGLGCKRRLGKTVWLEHLQSIPLLAGWQGSL